MLYALLKSSELSINKVMLRIGFPGRADPAPQKINIGHPGPISACDPSWVVFWPYGYTVSSEMNFWSKAFWGSLRRSK
jgi:hypothetical protein